MRPLLSCYVIQRCLAFSYWSVPPSRVQQSKKNFSWIAVHTSEVLHSVSWYLHTDIWAILLGWLCTWRCNWQEVPKCQWLTKHRNILGEQIPQSGLILGFIFAHQKWNETLNSLRYRWGGEKYLLKLSPSSSRIQGPLKNEGTIFPS